MKICFLTQNLNPKDGGGRFSGDLVSNLKNAGFEIAVLTHLDLLKNPLVNFFKIRKIFKNSDIIHAVDIWPDGFYAKLISSGLKKPVVITALGTFSVAPFYSRRRPAAVWTCGNSRIIAISEYTKSEIGKILPDLKIDVICPGFDLDFWSGSSNGAVAENIGRMKPYILSVGALKPRKGFHNSIAAFGIVAKKIKNLNYIIVGQAYDNSAYFENLKRIAETNNVKDRVIFKNSGIDDKELLEFYKNAELFVLTPVEINHHFEGFGIVYLEAAAAGLPVVASEKSGAVSAVEENYNGILALRNDPESAAEAILKILENPEIRERFGRHGREWVKNFSWEKITKKYAEIYNADIKRH